MAGIARIPKDWRFIKLLVVVLLGVELCVFLTAYFMADLPWSGPGW